MCEHENEHVNMNLRRKGINYVVDHNSIFFFISLLKFKIFRFFIINSPLCHMVGVDHKGQRMSLNDFFSFVVTKNHYLISNP